MDDLEKELEKMRFHLKMLGEAIDSHEHPITSLVVYMNWDESDLDAAHDIFESFDRQNAEGRVADWNALERELEGRFDINYQTVKTIVLAFYRNHQWIDICRKYAMAHECVEFHEITRSPKWH